MPTRKSSEKGLHDASDCDTFAGDAVREGAGRCVAGRVDVYASSWCFGPEIQPSTLLAPTVKVQPRTWHVGRRRGWNLGVVRWETALAAWG